MAGYVKIWTTLRNNAAFLSLPGNARSVYLQVILAAKEQRDEGTVCYRNVTALGSDCGYDRRTADKMLTILSQSCLLTFEKGDNGVLTVTIPKYKHWQEITALEVQSRGRINVTKIPPTRPEQTRADQSRAKQSRPSIQSGKPDDEIPYEEIISDLNQTINASYRHKTPKTRELIRVLWNQEFRLEDFKYVHRVKAADWQHDPKFKKFLRPITLYSTKFEGYRNQPMPNSEPLDRLGDKSRETFMAGVRVLARMEKENGQKTEDC